MQRQLWTRAKELRGRRQTLTGKIAELVAIGKGRELDGSENDKLSQMQAEIDDINSRLEQLEELMYEEEEEEPEEEREDDNGDGVDDGNEKRSRKKKRRSNAPDDDEDDEDDTDAESRRREERRHARQRGERESTSGGRYEEGETLILPNGQRARVLRRGNRERTRQRETEREVVTGPIAAARNRRSRREYREAFASYIDTGSFHHRALQQDVDVQAGFLVTPVQVYEQIMKIVDNMLFIRQLATKVQVVGAQSLGVPTLDTDPEDADWTAEIATVDEDSALAFGRRDLRPNALTKAIKVSERWLRNAIAKGFMTGKDDPGKAQGHASVSGPEDLISKRFGYKFGVSQEQQFISGSGIGKPLGLCTASSRGISTGRDVATGSATSVTYNGLINAIYNQRVGYDNQWLVSRSFMTIVRKLVDSQNRPLFVDPMEFGKPELLLGYAYNMSEYCPATFTNGLYVGIFGDFSYYIIADGMDFYIKKLLELFAMTNQVGFIGYMECDGMPGMEDAFTRLKCST